MNTSENLNIAYRRSKKLFACVKPHTSPGLFSRWCIKSISLMCTSIDFEKWKRLFTKTIRLKYKNSQGLIQFRTDIQDVCSYWVQLLIILRLFINKPHEKDIQILRAVWLGLGVYFLPPPCAPPIWDWKCWGTLSLTNFLPQTMGINRKKYYIELCKK